MQIELWANLCEPSLKSKSGQRGTKRFVLGAGQSLRVGAHGMGLFSFPLDDHMSSVHFRIDSDPSGCFLQDEGSTNGTLLNGHRVETRMPLQTGDQIVVGNTRFVVHLVRRCARTRHGLGGRVSLFSSRFAARRSRFRSTRSLATRFHRGRISAWDKRDDRSGTYPRHGAELPPGLGKEVPIPAVSKVPFTVETCESKLTLCRGRVVDATPADVASGFRGSIRPA